MATEKNPLLSFFDTPFETVPFNLIKPEHFLPALNIIIAQARKVFKETISNNEEPDFQNTIIPIEKCYDEISKTGSILFNLNSAATSPEIQAITQKVSPKITRFMAQLMVDYNYFKRVEKVYEKRFETGLSQEEIWLTESTYKNMKRSGANLSEEEKKKLISIQMRLSTLNLKFNENVLSETNNFELHLTDVNQLSGLPESLIESAAQLAKSKNKEGCIFTLHFPSYGPFMKYSNNRQLREELYRAYTSRCNHNNASDNKNTIKKIVNHRLKEAKLLGYNNFAQYVLEERMAESPEKVTNFLEVLHNASRPFALKEIEAVKNFARKDGLEDELMPWDLSYYSEKLKNTTFGFDEEMVKPYFELGNVTQGIFSLAKTLYGLTFVESQAIPKYHPEVQTYEVYRQDQEFVAILYADFFPRENKQSGAWMTEYRSQSNIGGKMIRPHISICTNFSRPTTNKPSLLTFNELTTFLHEFGHALHGMLANTVYPSLSGTNVYRDFVELPSQIMENWATEHDWLSTFAFHYETGKPMPPELVEKIIDSRNFQAGYLSERQLSFGMLDMAWHTLSLPFKKDISEFERGALKPTQLFPTIEGSGVSTSFSHIFAVGYASGYYGYKWAEVLDADAFSLFKRNGIFNPEISARFKNEILEKGGTEHPMKLYLNFRGKEPDPEELLKRSGLKN